jgi:predicted DNA-binding ribbon-helix-helix protein
MAKKTAKVRANFRLEKDILQWMKRFAKKNKMTVTAVVERAVEHMRGAADGRG